MSKPLMFLVAGVNGSGKSTLTKTIRKKHPDLEVIDPDNIGVGYSKAPAMSLGRAALEKTRDCINKNQSFIVESTISGTVYLRLLKKAKEKGFKTILVYVALSSVELSEKRVEKRVLTGGHGIPIDDIKRRYPKSLNNFSSHLKLCDLTYLYDNSEDYKMIASYRDGMLHREYFIPDWIKRYLPTN